MRVIIVHEDGDRTDRVETLAKEIRDGVMNGSMREQGVTVAVQSEESGATPFAWVCYHYDMGAHIDAIFDGEIEALRYAVRSGYLNVAPIGIGEIGNLP